MNEMPELEIAKLPIDQQIRIRVDQFDKRHSTDGPGIADGSGGWIIYPDGAKRDVHTVGLLAPPPDAPYERAKRVVFYWELTTKRAEKEFENRKQQMLAYANVAATQPSCPGPGSSVEQASEELIELRRRVHSLRERAAKARRAMEDSKPDDLTRRELGNAQNRESCSRFVATVQDIKL